MRVLGPGWPAPGLGPARAVFRPEPAAREGVCSRLPRQHAVVGRAGHRPDANKAGGNHMTALSLSRGASRTDPMTARQSELRRDSATSTAGAGWSERKPPFGEPRSAEEPHELERLRTEEHERGRHAAHPLQIPWLGWKDILWRTYREMQTDRLFSIAAGVAFFVLLAIFPAITAPGLGLWLVLQRHDNHRQFLPAGRHPPRQRARPHARAGGPHRRERRRRARHRRHRRYPGGAVEHHERREGRDRRAQRHL